MEVKDNQRSVFKLPDSTNKTQKRPALLAFRVLKTFTKSKVQSQVYNVAMAKNVRADICFLI